MSSAEKTALMRHDLTPKQPDVRSEPKMTILLDHDIAGYTKYFRAGRRESG